MAPKKAAPVEVQQAVVVQHVGERAAAAAPAEEEAHRMARRAKAAPVQEAVDVIEPETDNSATLSVLPNTPTQNLYIPDR
jgi:hypothetical protein